MSDTPRSIAWTVQSARMLRKQYELAVQNKQTVFTVSLPDESPDEPPVEFDTGYAKYLLEYLESHFKGKGS